MPRTVQHESFGDNSQRTVAEKNRTELPEQNRGIIVARKCGVIGDTRLPETNPESGKI